MMSKATVKVIGVIFSFFLWASGNGVENSQQIPTNVRGYLYYPKFGPDEYRGRKLEVIFDYDSRSIDRDSTIRVECVGYRNCSKIDDRRNDSSGCDDKAVDWEESRSSKLRPYQSIRFDAPDGIDRYWCRAAISGSGGSGGSNEDPSYPPSSVWSDFGAIELLDEEANRGPLINPKPTLVVCQALYYPKVNYGRSHLIRVIELDAANTPNETQVQNFDLNCNLAYNGQGALASYATTLCFDWVANWQYRLNTTDRRCLIKIDALNLKDELAAGCFDSKIRHLECYSPLGLVYFTMESPDGGFRVYRFDSKTDSSRIVIDQNRSLSTCDRRVTHDWLTLDWRPYWTATTTGRLSLDAAARLVLVSDGELWTYDLIVEECRPLISLDLIRGLDRATLPDDAPQFDMDWSNFYWINGSTYEIHAYSWATGNVTVFEKLRIYNAETQEELHNLSTPIYENMTNMVSLMKYTPAARPYPLVLDCLIPRVTVTVRIVNETNAMVTVEKQFNDSAACTRTNQPPPQLRLACESGESRSACEIGIAMNRGRSRTFSTELKGLVEGKSYNVTIQTSIIGNEKLFRLTTHPFVARLPDSGPVWEIIGLAVAILIVLASALAFYLFWYRKRKAMRDFLRRERIDASELSLVNQLGQGEFGEVWLAHYRPTSSRSKSKQPEQGQDKKKKDEKQSGQLLEVALKMRKSNGFNYRSTLMSADCFFQEAVALNFLRHTNIVLAYGLCMNYKQLPPILVLEYMNGGNCIDYLKVERSRLVNADLIKICRDVLRACVHLSDMSVVHKDIGARNVLVRKNTSTGKPELAKVTDFGLARDVGRRENVYAASSNKESVFHISSTAPEGFAGRFSTQSDVWSFGVFVWELYSLMDIDQPIPYADLSAKASAESILNFLKSGRTLDNPRAAPVDVCILMRQCWALEPSERPTFKQLNAAWRLIGQNQQHDTNRRQQQPQRRSTTSVSLVTYSSCVQEHNHDSECANVGYARLNGSPTTPTTDHGRRMSLELGDTPKNDYSPWIGIEKEPTKLIEEYEGGILNGYLSGYKRVEMEVGGGQ